MLVTGRVNPTINYPSSSVFLPAVPPELRGRCPGSQFLGNGRADQAPLVTDRFIFDTVSRTIRVLIEIVADFLCEEVSTAKICARNEVDHPMRRGILENFVPFYKRTSKRFVVGEQVAKVVYWTNCLSRIFRVVVSETNDQLERAVQIFHCKWKSIVYLKKGKLTLRKRNFHLQHF